MFFVIIGTVLWIALALWPAFIARRKGYSFLLYFLISLLFWWITLFVVLAKKDRNQTAEYIAADKAAVKALEKEENQQ